jgi:hypothetical protein
LALATGAFLATAAGDAAAGDAGRAWLLVCPLLAGALSGSAFEPFATARNGRPELASRLESWDAGWAVAVDFAAALALRAPPSLGLTPAFPALPLALDDLRAAFAIVEAPLPAAGAAPFAPSLVDVAAFTLRVPDGAARASERTATFALRGLPASEREGCAFT